MRQAVKSLSFFISGVLLAAGLLYFYSDTLFNRPDSESGTSGPEKIRPAEEGEAVITRISGEVYIIRAEKMIIPLPGDRVQEGDIIKVVDDSLCQVSFAGTASLKIRSNTLVKIRKLLSGNKDADIRTELLTGSMIYKVEELMNSENLQILAQERIYRVEGTEFMVQALPGGRTVVSVLDGMVAVLTLDDNQKETLLKSLEPMEKLELKKDETEIPEVQAFTLNDEEVFRSESPDDVAVEREDLVYLQILSSPEGAQIYINGRLNGYSEVSGLFLPDTELTILLRKRGYRDESFRLLPGELEDSRLIVEMQPLDWEDTLEEEEALNKTDPAVEEMRLRHQKELTELRTSFTRKLAEAQEQSDSLKKSETFLAQENMNLESELADSREETRKLRELIKQIQELADDQQESSVSSPKE